MARTGEQTVTIPRNDLLTRLKENRGGHQARFEEAWEGYCRLAERHFRENLKLIRQREPFNPYCPHTPPEDHTDDYDTAIEAYSMDVNETVELTLREFGQYVRDEWGWKSNFEASNTAYYAAARR